MEGEWDQGRFTQQRRPERFGLGVCDGDPHTHWACDSSVDPCGESDIGWRVSKRAQSAGVETFLRHCVMPCVCMGWSEREARWGVPETDSTASVPVSSSARDRPSGHERGTSFEGDRGCGCACRCVCEC